MRREQQIRRPALPAASHDHVVAHDRAEAIDLRAQLHLDHLALLQGGGSFLGVRFQRRVRRDVGRGRDGAWVRDALGDLLAFVHFCDFSVEQGVTALAELDDVCAFGAPACGISVN